MMKFAMSLVCFAPAVAFAATFLNEAVDASGHELHADKALDTEAVNPFLYGATIYVVSDTEGVQPMNQHSEVVWDGTSKYGNAQYFFAFLWAGMLGCLPLVVPAINKKRPTRSQLVVGGTMMVVFFGGLYLFTHIIIFQSSHFKEKRPLTIIECMYFMSQVITTVGYGDITPAKTRGQVFVGLYVLGALFIISMVVSDVVNQVVESTAKYKQKLTEAKETPSDEGVKRTTSKGLSNTVGSLKQMLSTAPQRPSAQNLLVSLAIFGTIDAVWVCFFSLHPDEGKNTFQAIYMSVITLSSVGFGFFTPVTEEGMIFAAFFFIFGCAALVNVVTQFTELMVKLNEWEKACPKAAKQEAVTNLEQHADNNQLTDVDFMSFCLSQSKLVEQSQLDRIMEAFHRWQPKEVQEKDGSKKLMADVRVIKRELLKR